YKGTLLLVSHDRALLDAATDTTLALTGNGKADLFEGAYSAWRAEQEAPVIRTSALTKTTTTSSAPPPTATAHGQSKERQRAVKRVATIEADIAKLEAQLATVEAGLSAPKDADHALNLAHEYTTVKDALSAKFDEWEAATMEAEALGASLQP
ncbi:MAG: hypothetical protein EOO39_10750, partial [Cytophagaceae bacterium]